MTAYYESLDQYVGEQVIAEMIGDKRVVGTLESYEEDFSLTLSGDGGPNVDDMTLGELSVNWVDGERVLNGNRIDSVTRFEEFQEDRE